MDIEREYGIISTIIQRDIIVPSLGRVPNEREPVTIVHSAVRVLTIDEKKCTDDYVRCGALNSEFKCELNMHAVNTIKHDRT